MSCQNAARSDPRSISNADATIERKRDRVRVDATARDREANESRVRGSAVCVRDAGEVRGFARVSVGERRLGGRELRLRRSECECREHRRGERDGPARTRTLRSSECQSQSRERAQRIERQQPRVDEPAWPGERDDRECRTDRERREAAVFAGSRSVRARPQEPQTGSDSARAHYRGRRERCVTGARGRKGDAGRGARRERSHREAEPKRPRSGRRQLGAEHEEAVRGCRTDRDPRELLEWVAGLVIVRGVPGPEFSECEVDAEGGKCTSDRYSRPEGDPAEPDRGRRQRARHAAPPAAAARERGEAPEAARDDGGHRNEGRRLEQRPGGRGEQPPCPVARERGDRQEREPGRGRTDARESHGGSIATGRLRN